MLVARWGQHELACGPIRDVSQMLHRRQKDDPVCARAVDLPAGGEAGRLCSYLVYPVACWVLVVQVRLLG